MTASTADSHADYGGEEYARIVENICSDWHMIAIRTYYEADSEAYGTQVEKKKLNTFNNSQIVSDAIGNILSDGTWSYTWQGRKLTGMSNNSKSITFLYDENGQRIRKAVTENGNTVTTEYVVSGKSVTHVIKGTEDLHIFYANGQPSHCKYGNSMYTYVYSLQGDVLGLKDNAGALVVTYLNGNPENDVSQFVV